MHTHTCKKCHLMESTTFHLSVVCQGHGPCVSRGSRHRIELAAFQPGQHPPSGPERSLLTETHCRTLGGRPPFGNGFYKASAPRTMLVCTWSRAPAHGHTRVQKLQCWRPRSAEGKLSLDTATLGAPCTAATGAAPCRGLRAPPSPRVQTQTPPQIGLVLLSKALWGRALSYGHLLCGDQGSSRRRPGSTG